MPPSGFHAGKTSRRALVPLVLVLASGCAIPLRNGENAPTLARKTVTQKLLPDTLVASDGTRCTPTSGKFAATSIRADAWCIWLTPPRLGTAASPR